MVYKRKFDPNSLPTPALTFRQWLAGVIDGDGYFGFCKKRGNPRAGLRMEMSVEKADLPLLLHAFQGLGYGSIRCEGSYYRLAIGERAAVLHLISLVEGYSHNSTRRDQIEEILRHYTLPITVPPQRPVAKSGWAPGFFDADGTLVLTQSGERGEKVKITVSATNNKLKDLLPLKESFGGTIVSITRKDTQTTHHRWHMQGQQDILNFTHYAQSAPFQSQKSKRFALVARAYALHGEGAHLVGHERHGEWLELRKE